MAVSPSGKRIAIVSESKTLANLKIAKVFNSNQIAYTQNISSSCK